jgi:hypothetical protein
VALSQPGWRAGAQDAFEEIVGLARLVARGRSRRDPGERLVVG